MELTKHYINGAFVAGENDRRLEVDDPADGQVFAEVALASQSDIDKAVAAARAAHDDGSLRKMRPVNRGRIVQEMGHYLLAHKEKFAALLARESGKPLWEAMIEIEGSARYFEYYGNQAETVEGRSIPLGDGYFDFTLYEPLGISGQIIPWNYPVEMAARGIAPALATGNAVVVKSPELDPLAMICLAEAAEAAGLPKGQLNILCGYGHEAGAALSGHHDINQLVFTGSVQTGQAVAMAAAKNLVPAVLELGGKSAAIVRKDADIANLMESVRWGIFFNAGQVCSAMSRMLIPHEMKDEIEENLVSLASRLSVGPGLERSSFGDNMGAMVSEKQRDRAVEMVERAASQGARIAAGGHKLNRPGWFMEPTIVMDVTPDMEIAREEVFGPVLSVLTYGDDAEALEIANGTDYGLVSGIFTQDIDAANKAARDLRAGQVFVNEWYAGGVETPFGGVGKSGYGREKGREALWNYVQTKNIAFSLR